MKRHERTEALPGYKKYDEYKHLPQFWGWVLLLAWTASLIAWGMWLHLVIPEEPRYWDYGQKPFTPAESIFSSVRPPAGMEPAQQIPTLPEARPLKPPPGEEQEGGE
jgi:hypothetical protein